MARSANGAGGKAPLEVGVLGAGTMGAGIAQVAAQAGHPVRLYDVAEAPLARGMDGAAAGLRRAAERGRLSPEAAEAAIGRLAGSTELEALGPVGLVIEAAPESLELKRALFERLAREVVAESCVLASNTSTLSIASLARDLPRPERVCGMHFFNPAPAMPLVEVIRGAFTDEATLALVAGLASAWGKTPVICADTPGFIVNRVARPFYGEALRLLGDGVADVATIDRLARDAGFPMGPFELMDLIGIDVNLAAAQSVYEGFFGEPRFRPHPIQRQMVDSGRLGRKTGRGYYSYGPDGKPLAAPAATAPPPAGPARPSRLVVLGEGGGLAAGLVERFADTGLEVIGSPDEEADVARWRELVASCDAAVEAELVDPEAKARAVALLDRSLPPEALLLTACHARAATEVASITDYPERVVGFALLPPWEARRTVECARALQTGEAAVAAAESLWRLAGLEPAWLGDSTGLVLPRLVAALANEAAFAVQERVAGPAEIDRAMRLGTRYPRGPLAWAEAIGLDAVLATLDALAADIEPGRYRAAPLLRRLAAAEWPGLGEE